MVFGAVEKVPFEVEPRVLDEAGAEVFVSVVEDVEVSRGLQLVEAFAVAVPAGADETDEAGEGFETRFFPEVALDRPGGGA